MNFLVIVLLFVIFLQTRIMDLRRAIICPRRPVGYHCAGLLYYRHRPR